MKHLSDAELVEGAERALPPGRAAHLDSCDRCRAAVDHLAATMREISAVEVPEPSPLFWEHFSTRVHDALTSEEPADARVGLVPTWARLLAFCVVLMAVATIAWVGLSHHPSAPALTSASNAASASPALEPVEGSDDAAWAVLNAAASALNPNETSATDFSVRPAAVDTAVQQLTPQERTALESLLQNEMKHSSN